MITNRFNRRKHSMDQIINEKMGSKSLSSQSHQTNRNGIKLLSHVKDVSYSR